jgi:hypothetical protein
MNDLYKWKLAFVLFGNLFRAVFGIVHVKTICGFEKVKRGRHKDVNRKCTWETYDADCFIVRVETSNR